MSSFVPVYDKDLVIVSGKGARLTDDQGQTYLDFAAGVGVNGLGYGNRKIVTAIRKQAGRLIHASNLYNNERATALADRLAAIAFPSRVFLTNSGTESVEAALKFARRIGKTQDRTEFVAFEGSFHGRTMGALSLTWRAKYREPFEPLIPGVRFCPFDDLQAAAAVIGPRTAAVIVEPVQGEGGIRVAPASFLQGLSDLCRERGALLVAEEVQSGLGRTGRMFAYQHAGIRPDMVTLAKPLGGGMPLGAVLLREELAGELHVGDHGSTFGGNPIACAAGLVVLDVITSKDFLAKVTRKGQHLRAGLRALAGKYPGTVAEVRGLGLMTGIELTGAAGPVVAALRKNGILATRAGDTVLRLLPPLVIKRGEIDVLIGTLDKILATGAGAAVPAPLVGVGGAVG